MPAPARFCPRCQRPGPHAFCSYCGEPFAVPRLTVGGLLHDVLHYFTHLEHGFFYTLGQLLRQPGTMQRQYLAGPRSHYQKPFSLFFICGTAAALLRYAVYHHVLRGAADLGEVDFIHHRLVLLQAALLPLVAVLTWLAFRRSGYNYAETVVLLLYTFSVYFLLTGLVSLLKFVWVGLDTAYVELPLLLLYNTVTLVRFYRPLSPLVTALKSVVVLGLCFAFAQYLEDWVIHYAKH